LDIILKTDKPQTSSAQGGVSEGGRNNFLTCEAGKLRRSGLDHVQLLFELKKINLARCNPPINEQELEAICSSPINVIPV